MSGKVIGYVRVSSIDQNHDRQLEGITCDKVFIDKCSGKTTNRAELSALLNYIREGDTLVVHSMDRLARNLDDLRKIVNNLTSKDIVVKFIKENLTFNNERTPMSNLMLSIIGAVAEFERSLIKERQREGISIAKAKGIYKGRKHKLTTEQVLEAKTKLEQGVSKTRIAKDLNINRATLYLYLKEYAA